MYDPTKYGKEFGSELRKRQTPELERRNNNRPQILISSALFTLFGVVVLVESIHAIHTGAMVDMGRDEPRLNGYEATAFSILWIFLCGFCFWKTLLEKNR